MNNNGKGLPQPEGTQAEKEFVLTISLSPFPPQFDPPSPVLGDDEEEGE